MSHLLREKGVLLQPCPSSPNARTPFTVSVPAGRQCHHSAASSSAQLNTVAKVQTAARSGKCTLTHTRTTHLENNTILVQTHTHLLLFYTKSLRFTYSRTHSQISCGKAMAVGQHSHLHGAELVPWWWLVRQANTNFINPEVNTLWTVFQCFCTFQP